MRLRLGIVSETTSEFLNQVKLCLFSLRRNGGALRDLPVTLITNSEALDSREVDFLKRHFSPIDFKTSPRLGAIMHTSKLNVFYAIDPSTYDVLIFMDCDTVVRKPLDRIVDLIAQDDAQFVCRRGGVTDRDRFVDFDALVSRICGPDCTNRILFDGVEEWPMLNTGIFLATPEAVRQIRRDSVEFTYALFNDWLRTDALERTLLPGMGRILRSLYEYKRLRPLFRAKLLSRHDVIDAWPLEQGSVALACIKSGIRVRYLDEIYNSWGGDEDFHILHCFKSLYRFDRRTMYAEDSENWIEEYSKSDVPGKRFLAAIVRDYKQTIHDPGT